MKSGLNIWRGVLSFKDLKGLGPKKYERLGDRHIKELEYRAIYKDGIEKKMSKVICVAADKTKQVALELQLDLDRQKASLITSGLRNPVDFIDLIEDTRDLLENYPKIKKIDRNVLFRNFHTLKARYGQFSAKRLTSFINEIETAISESRKKFRRKS